MKTARRQLIVNADDFGQSRGINRGIIDAHERGIVTSASLMPRWPAAAEAAAYAAGHPHLSVGLHVELGEWVYRHDRWEARYQLVALDDPAAVAEAVALQLKGFRSLVGQNPTHLDSHQHVHRSEPVRSILMAIAQELGVPLRDCCREVRYRGDFYGQTAEGVSIPGAISVDALVAILSALEAGITEVGCHPGWVDDLDTTYRAERADEVRSLCDPRVRAALVPMGIQLRSFHGVNRLA